MSGKDIRKALGEYYISQSPNSQNDPAWIAEDNLTASFIEHNINRVYAVCWTTMLSKAEARQYGLCELETIAAYASLLLKNGVKTKFGMSNDATV